MAREQHHWPRARRTTPPAGHRLAPGQQRRPRPTPPVASNSDGGGQRHRPDSNTFGCAVMAREKPPWPRGRRTTPTRRRNAVSRGATPSHAGQHRRRATPTATRGCAHDTAREGDEQHRPPGRHTIDSERGEQHCPPRATPSAASATNKTARRDAVPSRGNSDGGDQHHRLRATATAATNTTGRRATPSIAGQQRWRRATAFAGMMPRARRCCSERSGAVGVGPGGWRCSWLAVAFTGRRGRCRSPRFAP